MAIRESRIEPTRRLAELAAASGSRLSAFVSASAVGVYGYDRGDALLVRGQSRAATASWPTWSPTGRPPPRPPPTPGCERSCVRTGIVQAAAGGTLKLLRPLFAAGLGGRLGSGRQWLSWIGIDDLLDIYYRALYDTRLSGPVNAVGPEPGAQQRVHQGAGQDAAPAGAAAGPVDRTRAFCWASRVRANWPRPTSGCCRPSCRRSGTASGTRRSTTRWPTSSATTPLPGCSRDRRPARSPGCAAAGSSCTRGRPSGPGCRRVR